MTLNITVATPECIYQSADYRLTDWTTGAFFDLTQKIQIVQAFSWSAVVCFSGVGRTKGVTVDEWLAKTLSSIGGRDPFDRLIEGLVEANSWLDAVPPTADRRHSFSVGAFVGTAPLFVLVSNYETLTHGHNTKPEDRLSVSQIRPRTVQVFLSGRHRAVTRAQRVQLERAASQQPTPEAMQSLLAGINLNASRDPTISPACFTGYITLTGYGGGQQHGETQRQYPSPLHLPPSLNTAINKLVAGQFPQGRRWCQ